MTSILVNHCDQGIARHHSARALCAIAHGWGIGLIDARRNGDVLGSCQVIPPQGRSANQLVVEEITIRMAARVGAVLDETDAVRCDELAHQLALSDWEGQALLDWCHARAVGLVDRADRAGILGRVCAMLNENGGVIDSPREAVRDITPLIEVRAAPINITVPPAAAPVINLTLPEQPAPLVTIENQIDLHQPDRVVTFARNFAGQIVEATISDESETEPEPETTT